MKGRLRIAVVMAVFMIAIVALPTFAHAATFSGEWPIAPGTYHSAPVVVGVNVLNTAALQANTAAFTIDGMLYSGTAVAGHVPSRMAYFVQTGAIKGSWTQTETGPDALGQYHIVWTWTTAAGAFDSATLYCYPTSALSVTTTHTITASVKDILGNTLTDGNTWQFAWTANSGAIAYGIKTPLNGATVTTTAITPSVKYTDAKAALSVISYTLNGASFYATASSGSIAPTNTVAMRAALLDAGLNTVSIAATDSLGNSAATSWSFVVNTPNGCARCHTGWDTDPDMGPVCANCHPGKTWPHVAISGSVVKDEFAATQASRHNVSDAGFGGSTAVGMKSRFDGTQGITLLDTNGNSVVNTFGVPTVNVFKTTPVTLSTGATTLTSDTVIKCVDCHTGMSTPVAGPHGAASAKWLIDPNYPASYEMGVLSHLTDSGMLVRTSLVDTTTASLMDASNAGNQYAMICAKCHDLYNVGTGITGTSNTAHGSHHYDRNDGTADCISCHVAIPHGWKRPRLLVNGYAITYTDVAGSHVAAVDAAPYWSGRGREGYGSGMGPISTSDNHSLNASGGAPWTESDCLACNDHTAGVATETGKLK
jgi:hypothetical protein